VDQVVHSGLCEEPRLLTDGAMTLNLLLCGHRMLAVKLAIREPSYGKDAMNEAEILAAELEGGIVWIKRDKAGELSVEAPFETLEIDIVFDGSNHDQVAVVRVLAGRDYDNISMQVDWGHGVPFNDEGIAVWVFAVARDAGSGMALILKGPRFSSRSP
jgi:hypothetical protein